MGISYDDDETDIMRRLGRVIRAVRKISEAKTNAARADAIKHCEREAERQCNAIESRYGETQRNVAGFPETNA